MSTGEMGLNAEDHGPESAVGASAPERRAVLFDLDGVLVDTEHPALAALDEVFREHAMQLPTNALQRLCGRTAGDIVGVVTDWVGDPDLARRLLERRTEVLDRRMREDGVRAFPGARGLLRMLRAIDWPVAVASSSSRRNVYWKLEQAGLASLVPTVLGGDEVRLGKPDPEIFLRAADALGVEPARCTVVEDSPAGVQAARRAGMRCVAVTHTFPAADLKGADLLVGSLRGIGMVELVHEGSA